MFHWTFAIEYLKALLKLPIILDIFDVNADKQLRRAKMITRVATLIFYLAVLFWTVMMEFAEDWIYRTHASRLIVSSIQIAPAIVLVSSTLCLRRLIKRVGQGLFLANEGLMILHTGLFLSYIVLAILDYTFLCFMIKFQ